jgi:hypothetical protein
MESGETVIPVTVRESEDPGLSPDEPSARPYCHVAKRTGVALSEVASRSFLRFAGLDHHAGNRNGIIFLFRLRLSKAAFDQYMRKLRMLLRDVLRE